MTTRPTPHAQPPIETDNIKVGRPKVTAAGVTAVVKSLEFVVSEAGPARGAAALYRLNQFKGFDCPGCAWPDPDKERTANEYCENGAKAVAEEATKDRVLPEFFKQHSVSELSAQSDLWLGKRGRLTHPMVLRAGSDHYEPIQWNDAFALIAKELNALKSPDEAVFYTSGRTSNEAAFLYQLFARQFGTNNLPDCSNMCHESSSAALGETIGVGKGTVKLDDFEKSDLILIMGQNPGTNHPRMLTTLLHAVRKGATIVSINPLSETGVTRFKHPQEVGHLIGPGTKLAKHFVQVRLSGDLAFLQGLGKEILEEEVRRPGQVINKFFIDHKTDGFEKYRIALGEVSWDSIVKECGIKRGTIKEIADLVMKSKSMITCWAMGLTQQRDAVATG